jgi:hypothetical protein
MARISVENVASAVRKVQAMNTSEQISLADEIFKNQPSMLGSCLALKGRDHSDKPVFSGVI